MIGARRERGVERGSTCCVEKDEIDRCSFDHHFRRILIRRVSKEIAQRETDTRENARTCAHASSYVIEHGRHVFGREGICGVAQQHAGLADVGVSHDGHLDFATHISL